MLYNLEKVNESTAGIRIGYGAMPLWLINYLWRVKQPYNVSVIAEEAAIAALNSTEYLQVNNRINILSSTV